MLLRLNALRNYQRLLTFGIIIFLGPNNRETSLLEEQTGYIILLGGMEQKPPQAKPASKQLYVVEQSRTDSFPLKGGKHCYGQYFSTENIKHSEAHWMSILDVNEGNDIWICKPLGYDLAILTKYGEDFT